MARNKAVVYKTTKMNKMMILHNGLCLWVELIMEKGGAGISCKCSCKMRGVAQHSE